MSTWGVDLWDNRDNIEKHTLNGIEFLDKCSSFIKDRIRIEQEYAKSLRRLVKQFQFRKKEELPFTYQESFKGFLNETDDFAGQREVIAENIQENVLNKMQKLASDLRTDRKKAISTLNDHKANLDQLQKVLQNAKKKYEQASEEANNALKSFKTASENLDLTKALILKFQKISQIKGHLAEKASDEYKVATDNFNKAQTLYYEGDLNNELQLPEETRIEMLKNFFIEVSNIQQKVQPIISRCLEGMVKAAEICNPTKDSLTLIDMHKTGNSVPGSVAFEEWGKPNTSSLPVPVPAAKMRQKTTKSFVFTMSSKKCYFDDEMRCTVIYDFSGINEGELTVYAGEKLIVIEEDDGSGWTRVMRGQEEGYIPTAYVQNI